MKTGAWIKPFALGVSLALHGALVAGTEAIPPVPLPQRTPTTVDFEVPPPIVAPKPKPAPKVEPPEPAPKPRRAAPIATAPREEPREEPPADQPGGVTLAADAQGDADGWMAPLGNGLSFVGPMRAPLERPVQHSVDRTKPVPRPAAPPLVAPRDLSERLRPPALDAQLQRAYPPEARQRGIGGVAVVRARIGPDGIARRVRVVSESFPGFGAACRKTLTGSRWSSPRDRNGHAVTTEIRYTCHFVVSSR